MILKRNGEWLRKPCFPDQEARDSIAQADQVWRVSWFIMRLLIAGALLLVLVAKSQAATYGYDACLEKRDHVLLAQYMMTIDKRSVDVVQKKFVTTIGGNKNAAARLWVFAGYYSDLPPAVLADKAMVECLQGDL